jgi:DNA-3-methyladenine glycosylase I
MSHELVRRGFKFVGATICYALMQATGMVNDHLVTCPRHAELGGIRQRSSRSQRIRKEEQKTTKITKGLRKLRKRHPFLSSFASVEL